MWRATFKSLLSRKLRLVLSGLAVVLGVMSVSGALVLTDTLGRSFDVLFQTVFDDLDVQVTGTSTVKATTQDDPVTALLPASVVDKVAAVDGVKTATGTIFEDGARPIGKDGKVIASSGPPSFGVAWSDGRGLIQLRDGRGPQRPDEIAMNAGLAKRGQFHVGDRVDVLTPGGRRAFNVVGVFGYTGGRDTFGGETRIAFTEPVAQQLMLGRVGVFSGVDVQAVDGVSQPELRQRVAEALGDGYTVRTGEQVAADQSASLQQFIGVIRSVLLGFAGVSLLVGVFLILNTFSILVAQRTRELALLRSLGAARRQVVGSVLAEAAVIGAVASTLGLAAGLGVAALLKQVMQSFSGAKLAVSGLTVPWSAAVAAYSVGIVVTLVAAVVPAVRASRTPPIAAMREAATADKPLRVLTSVGALATLAGAAAVGTALFRDVSGMLWILLFGTLLSFLGMAMLTPALSRPAVSALGRMFAWTVPGRLGRRNSARNPRRTAITAASLMIGIALVTGVSVVANSLSASIEQLVGRDLPAELVITGAATGRTPASFDPAVISQVARVEGVRDAVAVRGDVAQVGAKVTPVESADLGALADVLHLRRVSGELRPLTAGEVAVDDTFAADQHLTLGDRLDVGTARAGVRPLTIVGIYQKSQLLPGPVVSAADADAGFRSARPVAGYIALRPGADSAAVERQVNRLLADEPEVSVVNHSDYIDQQTSQVDTVVLILYILLALAIVIAVLGVVNTLALSIVERTRELGLVRAIGMRRGQVRSMVVVESVVIAVFGALLGLAVGSALGAAVTWALRDQGVPVLALPWASMTSFLGLAVVIGVLAAVVPAVRAARTNVLRAIAYE